MYYLPVKGIGTSSRAWVDPRDNPVTIVRHAGRLLRTEGPAGLLNGLWRFSVALGHRLYRNHHCRIYDLHTGEAASVSVAPPCDNVHVHIIESQEDALRLAQEGYENVLVSVSGMKRRLDAGAVAACAFVDSEFASVDWMAFSDDAKRKVDPLPFAVDFENGEAASGAAFTVRRFRRKGIGTYRISSQVRYLRDRGYRVCRCSIGSDNVPSQRCIERYGARFKRIGYLRRFLWWKTWCEIPVQSEP